MVVLKQYWIAELLGQVRFVIGLKFIPTLSSTAILSSGHLDESVPQSLADLVEIAALNHCTESPHKSR
jgi:hypothetical protein